MRAEEMMAVRLAQAVAPDEAELAPLLVEAFAEQGQGAQESVNMVGGFVSGAGINLILPLVLHGVAAIGPLLLKTLAAENTGTLLDCIKNGLQAVELLKKEPAEQKAELPAVPYASLQTMITTMSTSLRQQGLDPDQSDLVTFRVLQALLSEQQEATALAQKLAAAG